MIKQIIKNVIVNSDTLSAMRRLLVAVKGEISFSGFRKSYERTGYAADIELYRGKYQGKRCFIIGNGPSLKPEDLELLKHEYCFAANRIYLMYDKTGWRPSFYMCQDKDMLKAERKNLKKNTSECFVGYNSMVKDKINADHVKPYLMDSRAILWRKKTLPFSFECEKGVIDGTTVTYSSLQLAVYMGFTQIYLLGMDHHFANTIDKNRKITQDTSVQSHFDPNYKDVYKAAEQKKKILLAVYDKEMAENAYRSARAAAASKGIEIINVTRGGELEVFPRRNLEDVIWKN